MDKLLQESIRQANLPSATEGVDHWVVDDGSFVVLVSNWTGSYYVQLGVVNGRMQPVRVEDVMTEREVPAGVRWDYAARAALAYMGWEEAA